MTFKSASSFYLKENYNICNPDFVEKGLNGKELSIHII